MKRSILWILLIFVSSTQVVAVDLSKPTAWVNDYAGMLSPDEERALNTTLQDFEASDSTQIFVAIMDRIPGGMSVEGYVNELFERWRVGQKNKDNGVLLAVFIQDRKMRIEVGYGLEAKLTDAQSALIISNEIAPSFKQEQYYDGIRKGINGIIQATRGAYKGTGTTRRQPSPTGSNFTVFDMLMDAEIRVGIIVFAMMLAVVIKILIDLLGSQRKRSWTSRDRGSSTRRTSTSHSSARNKRRTPKRIWPRTSRRSTWSGGSSRSASRSKSSRRSSSWGSSRRSSSSRSFSGFSGGGGGKSGGGGASGNW